MGERPTIPPQQRYWERETPIIVENDKNRLTWFPMAGKLQISHPDRVLASGKQRRGRTITFDVAFARRDTAKAAQVRELLLDVIRRVSIARGDEGCS